MSSPSSRVELVAYEFPLGGIVPEIHTEIRAFGCDYWFEKNGARKITSRNKEKMPYSRSSYKLKHVIGESSLPITR